MKFLNVFAALAAVSTARCTPPKNLRTTTLYGVEVIDTDLVRDARAIIAKFTPYLYKHCMRAWLYGSAAINANETLYNTVDRELHAVATILHDLGWDMTPNSPYVSPDLRFEIDSALGAVNFVKQHKDAKYWDEYRLDKLHDGISLQISPGLDVGKSQDVQTIVSSILYDNPTAKAAAIPQTDYDNIRKGLPNFDIVAGTNETWTWLAQTKPASTYDNALQNWGTAYVPGYNATGHRIFDIIVTALEAEKAANSTN
ncbi:hypothetical protein F5Y03DRAFT_310011 [Xylaria venustula]|nr:hypothetical protein F5Y03DRAFT_310011 [Xylaria venustula]